MFRAAIFTIFVLAFAGLVHAQEKAPANCPTITVTGPAGIVELGQPVWTFATISGELPKDAELIWTTSQGEILSGQGTLSVEVSTKMEFAGTTTTVTLTITNLPDGCPASAYEGIPLIWEPAAVQLFEGTTESIDELQKDMRDVIDHMLAKPDSQLYVIGYFPERTSVQKILQARDRLTKMLSGKDGIDPSRITFVSGGEQKIKRKLFKFYEVPLGADSPAFLFDIQRFEQRDNTVDIHLRFYLGQHKNTSEKV